jgi:hypothetical protein
MLTGEDDVVVLPVPYRMLVAVHLDRHATSRRTQRSMRTLGQAIYRQRYLFL